MIPAPLLEIHTGSATPPKYLRSYRSFFFSILSTIYSPVFDSPGACLLAGKPSSFADSQASWGNAAPAPLGPRTNNHIQCLTQNILWRFTRIHSFTHAVLHRPEMSNGPGHQEAVRVLAVRYLNSCDVPPCEAHYNSVTAVLTQTHHAPYQKQREGFTSAGSGAPIAAGIRVPSVPVNTDMNLMIC